MTTAPLPMIAELPALTRDGTPFVSRINLDLLRDVQAAKKGDLFVRPAFEWRAG